MNVHYWPVGIRPAQPLPLTHDQMAGMLLQDWAPLSAPPPASALFGWPAHLIRPHDDGGTFYWEMHEELAGTERQWKRVIAWMLGVVGARHLLAEEGYRWIAPVSAFLADARHPIRTYNWHRAFRPGAVVAQGFSRQRANGTTRPRPTPLLPDYLAIRPRQVTGVRGWAAVEAKGTDEALHTAAKDRCPRPWRRQAWNLVVTLHGVPVPVPRHIVAATRVNPNARKAATRCLHVRGWNSADRQPPEPPPQLAVEIAAAHLFGLCLSLGLVENAAALAAGVEARSRGASEAGERRPRRDTLAALAASADEELDAHRAPATGDDRETRRIQRTLVSSLGSAEVTIEPATTTLIERLRPQTPTWLRPRWTRPTHAWMRSLQPSARTRARARCSRTACGSASSCDNSWMHRRLRILPKFPVPPDQTHATSTKWSEASLLCSERVGDPEAGKWVRAKGTRALKGRRGWSAAPKDQHQGMFE